MKASSVPVKVLTWEGSPSIEQAASLKADLVQALDQAAQVVVSLSLLDAIDLSAIQLLKAARKEADRIGKQFHLTGTVKPELARAFLVSGFSRRPTESARDIEFELFGSDDRAGKEP